MNIETQIQKLSAEYYKLISQDHHKDRDCHWKIEVVWSYGAPARYFVRHSGYIHDEVETEAGCYADALIELRDEIKRAIELETIRQQQDESIEFPDIPGELRDQE